MSLPLSLSLPSQLLLNLVPFTLAVCSVCQSANVWVKCPSCQSPLCPVCQPSSMATECVGCTVEVLLKDEPRAWKETIDAATRYLISAKAALSSIKTEEHGIQPVYAVWETPYGFPIHMPSDVQWIQSEHILQDFIHYTVQNTAQKPIPNYRYIIGRYIYPNSYPLISDYMLSYEKDYSGVYRWMRYISTYHDHSPCPYDGNIFYPAPLPLSVVDVNANPS